MSAVQTVSDLEAQTVSEYEMERGKPMPSTNHAIVQGRLSAAFLRYEDKYSVLPELSLELDGQPFVPDISLYPRLEVDWRHDEVKRTEPPLMIVEILSPRQVLDDLIHKAESYFQSGVKSCWIVQPVLETIVVLLPGAKPVYHIAGEVTDPATGVTVTVEEIFR